MISIVTVKVQPWGDSNIYAKESRWNLAAHVPPTIMEYYSDIHLEIDVLFVNKIPFLLVTSWDIGFTHCKALLSKHDKRIRNGLQQIILDYEAMEF